MNSPTRSVLRLGPVLLVFLATGCLSSSQHEIFEAKAKCAEYIPRIEKELREDDSQASAIMTANPGMSVRDVLRKMCYSEKRNTCVSIGVRVTSTDKTDTRTLAAYDVLTLNMIKQEEVDAKKHDEAFVESRVQALITEAGCVD